MNSPRSEKAVDVSRGRVIRQKRAVLDTKEIWKALSQTLDCPGKHLTPVISQRKVNWRWFAKFFPLFLSHLHRVACFYVIATFTRKSRCERCQMKRRQVSRDGKRERELIAIVVIEQIFACCHLHGNNPPLRKHGFFFYKVAAAAFLVSFCLHAGTLDRITTLSLDRLGILG